LDFTLERIGCTRHSDRYFMMIKTKYVQNNFSAEWTPMGQGEGGGGGEVTV